MFPRDRHTRRKTAAVALHFLLVLALLDTIVVAANRRNRAGRFPRRNAASEENGNEARHDEMKSIRQIIADESPRNVLVDVLHGGQYFQDIFAEHLEPLKIQFGHVCENPREWEQRFERKDLRDNKHRGKIRWGNDNGEYGEHYWDLNHR